MAITIAKSAFARTTLMVLIISLTIPYNIGTVSAYGGTASVTIDQPSIGDNTLFEDHTLVFEYFSDDLTPGGQYQTRFRFEPTDTWSYISQTDHTITLPGSYFTVEKTYNFEVVLMYNDPMFSPPEWIDVDSDSVEFKVRPVDFVFKEGKDEIYDFVVSEVYEQANIIDDNLYDDYYLDEFINTDPERIYAIWLFAKHMMGDYNNRWYPDNNAKTAIEMLPIVRDTEEKFDCRDAAAFIAGMAYSVGLNPRLVTLKLADGSREHVFAEIEGLDHNGHGNHFMISVDYNFHDDFSDVDEFRNEYYTGATELDRFHIISGWNTAGMWGYPSVGHTYWTDILAPPSTVPYHNDPWGFPDIEEEITDWTPQTFAAGKFVNFQTFPSPQEWSVDTKGSYQSGYTFMGVSDIIYSGSTGSLHVTGDFRLFDTFYPSLQNGRRYLNLYILDSTGTSIITSHRLIDYDEGTGWLSKSYTFNLDSDMEYRLGVGRGDRWARDWQLTAQWSNVEYSGY